MSEEAWKDEPAKSKDLWGRCSICGVPLIADPSRKVFCTDCGEMFWDEKEANHD